MIYRYAMMDNSCIERNVHRGSEQSKKYYNVILSSLLLPIYCTKYIGTYNIRILLRWVFIITMCVIGRCGYA